MKKLLFILLLLIPVHGAWGDEYSKKTGVHKKGDLSWSAYKSGKSNEITISFQNYSAKKILVVKKIKTFNHNCDKNSERTYEVKNRILPKNLFKLPIQN